MNNFQPFDYKINSLTKTAKPVQPVGKKLKLTEDDLSLTEFVVIGIGRSVTLCEFIIILMANCILPGFGTLLGTFFVTLGKLNPKASGWQREIVWKRFRATKADGTKLALL